LTFTNEDNVDQTMRDQFSEIAHEPSIGKHSAACKIKVPPQGSFLCLP